jgi:hypothetical protein
MGGSAAVSVGTGAVYGKLKESVGNIGGREEGEAVYDDTLLHEHEPMLLNGLKIQFIGAHHDIGNATQENLDIFRQHMRQATVVVPEYFPLEYISDLEADDLFGMVGRAQYKRSEYALFEYLDDIAAEEGKDVLMMDPANGKEYMVEAIGTAKALTAGSLGALAIPALLIAAKIEGTFDRRSFIRNAAIISLGSFLLDRLSGRFTDLEGHSRRVDPSENFSDTLRAACIAEHLIELSRTSQDKLVVIYPNQHILRIKRFLEDDKLRTELLQTARTFYGMLPHANQFLSRRSYRHQDGQWQPISSVRLQSSS